MSYDKPSDIVFKDFCKKLSDMGYGEYLRLILLEDVFTNSKRLNMSKLHRLSGSKQKLPNFVHDFTEFCEIARQLWIGDD